MQPLRVVEVKVNTQTPPIFTDCPVLMKIDFLILYCPPQPFNEDIVIHPTATIHAYPHFRSPKKICKLPRGKLHPLVGIKDLRPGAPERFF
jgi:hypothetical protein